MKLCPAPGSFLEAPPASSRRPSSPARTMAHLHWAPIWNQRTWAQAGLTLPAMPGTLTAHMLALSPASQAASARPWMQVLSLGRLSPRSDCCRTEGTRHGQCSGFVYWASCSAGMNRLQQNQIRRHRRERIACDCYYCCDCYACLARQRVYGLCLWAEW